ncbi:MAG: TonB-dependent receptor plug domain-containing protein, partial [Pseudomonadales bacterium]|nr:TonB-dependent receptor plug domain-containing protein [Pseudomonadales bacterium]
MAHEVFRTPKKFPVRTLAAAISLALIPVAQQASAQNDTSVEEVIVTGSFIRRSEGIAAASPVVQFSAEDIEAEGTINMAQVVQNLTFNNGTGVINSIQGSTNQIASFNLRGLGTRATLPLIDGKRVPTANVQLLLPAMALQRMDIVTDGAAALYGTDAVAGVVNMVPYRSYDGIKVEAYEEQDSRGDYWRRETSFLAGRSFGDVDLVVAGSYQVNDALAWHDRPEYVLSGLTHNSGSNPGNFETPVRDENGDLTGTFRNRPDPSCGLNESPDQNAQFNSPWGTNALGRCWLSFGDTRDFMEELDSTNLYGSMTWDANEDITFNAQVLYNRQVVRGRQNPGNPGARIDDLPTVRGELPGNTFRAATSGGDLLFAEPLRDGNGDIINDAYGNAQWMRDANGESVLAQNRFADINTDPLGGVPFYEDVRIGSWLPFGKPQANTQPLSFQENDGLNMELDDKRTARFSFGADFNVPWLEGWRGKAEYMFGYTEQNDIANQDFSFSAVEQGLNCDQINDPEACFNPFGAQDARYRNSQQVADAVFTQFTEGNRDELQTLDIYINGDLPLGFELP